MLKNKEKKAKLKAKIEKLLAKGKKLAEIASALKITADEAKAAMKKDE